MRLLKAAGIAFATVASSVNERATEAPLMMRGASPAEVAATLADAKAMDVSTREPDALVIGADQTLDSDGVRWTKPANVTEARAQLARLAGRTHRLHSSVAVARDSAVIWRHAATASLTMRALTASEIDAYLATRIWQGCAGAYAIQEKDDPYVRVSEGSVSNVIGLPMETLARVLRHM